MVICDLGRMPYREAWALQEQAHEAVLNGGEEQLLMVEHPPVITFGRRPGGEKHLVASRDRLREMGVDLVESDRGGDVTFHGPGQLVVYPIIRLADYRLSVGGYVHRLEDVVIQTLSRLGIAGTKDPAAVGVWVEHEGKLAKICALGVRIRRGVSLHGIALNVETDLRYFQLIIPCGLAGRPVTSIQTLLGDTRPSWHEVQQALKQAFETAFHRRSSPR